jgi:hypothetical protein
MAVAAVGEAFLSDRDHQSLFQIKITSMSHFNS